MFLLRCLRLFGVLRGSFFGVLRIRRHYNRLCSTTCCNGWTHNLRLFAFENFLPNFEGADAEEYQEEAVDKRGDNEQEASAAETNGLKWLDDQDKRNCPDGDRPRKRNALARHATADETAAWQ